MNSLNLWNYLDISMTQQANGLYLDLSMWRRPPCIILILLKMAKPSWGNTTSCIWLDIGLVIQIAWVVWVLPWQFQESRIRIWECTVHSQDSPVVRRMCCKLFSHKCQLYAIMRYEGRHRALSLLMQQWPGATLHLFSAAMTTIIGLAILFIFIPSFSSSLITILHFYCHCHYNIP